jgi:hypothetical protein
MMHYSVRIQSCRRRLGGTAVAVVSPLIMGHESGSAAGAAGNSQVYDFIGKYT